MNVQVAGRTVELWREGSGPPLLYLHGLADMHSVWAPEDRTPLLHALSSERDVVAPALPGYLGSDGLGPRVDVEDHAFALADLLDALGLERVDVVGCSLGGWLAAELALRHPARVARLVLVDPLGLHVPDVPGALFFGAAAPRGVGGFGEVRGVLFAEPESAVALGALPDEPSADDMLRWFTGLTGAAAIGWSAPQLCNPRLAARLHRIAAPTLLVWGAEDRIAPPARAEHWCAGLPHARLELLTGAGHCAQLEQPERVAALALDHLRQQHT